MTATATLPPQPAPRRRPGPARRVGLRTRKLRAALSALGIAIGVAAIVAVLGLSASSQAGLLAEIDQLGTNLLTVTNGQTLVRRAPPSCPLAAPGMIARIGAGHRRARHRRRQRRQRLPQPADPDRSTPTPVRAGRQPRACPPPSAPRSPRAATSTPPPPASRSPCSAPPPRSGSASTGSAPASGSGSAAAVVLPGRHPQPGRARPRDRLRRARRLPRRAEVPRLRRPPVPIYLRARHRPGQRRPRPCSPPPPTRRAPTRSTVSQPSDALVARAEAKGALNSLFLGLGAVSLLVGAIGVGQHHAHLACSNAAPRSGCAARSAPPRATSAPSSSPRRSCSRSLGGAAGVGAGAAATAVYAHTSTGPPSSRRSPGPAASPPPCSSAPSPGCCPPSAPPACPRPKRSGRM